MLLEDHPLADTIWSVATGKQIDKQALFEAIKAKDYVMIGEKHDNPLHHQRQTMLVRHLRETGAKGQLVAEMAEQRHQSALDTALPDHLDQLGDAIEWEKRGWPAWTLYQPIFAEALKAGMALKAGNPDRATLMDAGKGEELDAALLKDLRWERDYAQTQRDDLLDELVDAHCGMMGRDAMQPLVTMQKLKDAFMARALRQGREAGDVAILIAGNGHTRKDRGVAMFLDDADKVVSVALIEVVRGETDASSYPSFDPALYDHVWFTPRLDEIDPCEKFRAQLEAMKSKMKANGTNAGGSKADKIH
ncbi:ChaN family lipoprotein [Cohaesibacter intestini]|uniref:ChaN family lipoprotein n=1 Tax=Cohaesibacter intestini TaxID=2211145 RepID=UPI0013004257|nr:ChaN family lipoprotein [Cohaesibacter intestini]